MDRDDAGMSDRSDEAQQGDTGMIGSESEEPGPGRDTSLTDPDPAAASTDQPRATVGMSEGDPMRTRLGSQIEGAGAIGHDVAASEEGATQETPAGDRPGYESERSGGASVATGAATTTAPTAFERDPGLAAEPVVDQGAYRQEPGYVGDEPVIDRGAGERTADPGVGVAAAGVGAAGGVSGVSAAGPGVAAAGEQVDDVGPSDSSMFDSEPGRDVPAAYTGEEADVTGRPEYAERTEGGDQPLYQEETQRMDRPGGGGSLFTDEEPERLDRPGPQEPGVQEGVFDQEADQARRPSDGV